MTLLYSFLPKGIRAFSSFIRIENSELSLYSARFQIDLLRLRVRRLISQAMMLLQTVQISPRHLPRAANF